MMIKPETMIPKSVAPIGDAFVDGCFSFDFTHCRDDRVWSRTVGLKDVPGLVKQNRLEDAWTILDATKDAFHDFDFIYAWKAVIFQKTGQTDAAQKILMAGLKHAKEKFLLCDRLGFLAYETGDLNQAVNWWIKSIAVMTGFNTVTMWEPFIYLAYVARACGSEKHFRLLMAQVAKISVHGELDLEADAVKKIDENAAALSAPSVLKAIDCLCSHFIKEADKGTAPARASLADHAPGQENTGSLTRRGKKPWMVYLALGLLVLAGLFVFFFYTKKPHPAPDGIKTTLPSQPIETQKIKTALAGPEKTDIPILPEEAPVIEPPKEIETGVPAQHKEKLPFLKVKAKSPNPIIKRKEPPDR